MDRIEVKVLNPDAAADAEKMMVCSARLTQRGHQIKSMADFMALYEKEYREDTANVMTALPHPTIQKFGVVNVVVTGASRRFLAQITRHQNEVKFMSASLQYSDYSGEAAFVVPYKVLEFSGWAKDSYLRACQQSMKEYADFVNTGIGHDSAGYMAPQGLRNILIISATPYQWKHMIGQRVCRRNTDETRYVMLRIWEQLLGLCPTMFKDAGPFCMNGPCKEGKMACGKVISSQRSPFSIIAADYPLLAKTRRLANEDA